MRETHWSLQAIFVISPPWCKVVKSRKENTPTMKRNKVEKRSSMKILNPNWVRASISFPSDLYESLQELAIQKKVSLAWVVRDAAERYVTNRTTETTGRGNVG
jgi:hypothetical protein